MDYMILLLRSYQSRFFFVAARGHGGDRSRPKRRQTSRRRILRRQRHQAKSTSRESHFLDATSRLHIDRTDALSTAVDGESRIQNRFCRQEEDARRTGDNNEPKGN